MLLLFRFVMRVHVHFLSAQFHRIDTPQESYRYVPHMPWVSIRSSRVSVPFSNVTVFRIDTFTQRIDTAGCSIPSRDFPEAWINTVWSYRWGDRFSHTYRYHPLSPSIRWSKSSSSPKCSWDVSMDLWGIDASQACVSIRLEDVSIRLHGFSRISQLSTHANPCNNPLYSLSNMHKAQTDPQTLSTHPKTCIYPLTLPIRSTFFMH